MKTIFVSQDGKRMIFLTSSREYPYVWKSVFLFKSSHLCSQTTRRQSCTCLRFQGKIQSQQELFAKCMTEMFALNYVLRVSAGP